MPFSLQDSASLRVSSAPLQLICAFEPSLGQLPFTNGEIQPFLTVLFQSFTAFLQHHVQPFQMFSNQPACILVIGLQP